MYKRDEILKTYRGNVSIVSKKTDFHIIDGIHPILKDSDILKLNVNKDYVIALKNTDINSSLGAIYEHLTQVELNNLILK